MERFSNVFFFYMMTFALMWWPCAKICCSDFDRKSSNSRRIDLATNHLITMSLDHKRNLRRGGNSQIIMLSTAAEQWLRILTRRFSVQGILQYRGTLKYRFHSSRELYLVIMFRIYHTLFCLHNILIHYIIFQKHTRFTFIWANLIKTA